MAKSLKGEDLIDLAKIHQTWKIYDFNHNGKLSLAEIDKALVELFPKYGKEKPVLMRAYRDADKSHDGYIEFNEFETLVKDLSIYYHLYEQFQFLDKNHDRRISFAEFKAGHDHIGIPTHSEHELHEAFNKLDKNHGGFILFDEFCAYMVKAHNAHHK